MADLIALGQQLPQQYHVAHIEMAIHDARRKHCMSMRAGLIVSVFMRSCPIFVQCYDISIFGGNTTPSDRLMQQADFVVFMQFLSKLARTVKSTKTDKLYLQRS